MQVKLIRSITLTGWPVSPWGQAVPGQYTLLLLPIVEGVILGNVFIDFVGFDAGLLFISKVDGPAFIRKAWVGDM